MVHVFVYKEGEIHPISNYSYIAKLVNWGDVYERTTKSWFFIEATSFFKIIFIGFD